MNRTALFLIAALTCSCSLAMGASRVTEAESPSSDAQTSEKRCASDYRSSLSHRLPLNRTPAHRTRVLARDPQNQSPPTITNIVSTPADSDEWNTSCGVFLGLPKPPSECACKQEILFEESSRLSIFPASQGLYFFTVERLKGGGNLSGTLVAHFESDGTGKREVTWLRSVATTLPNYDFYVYLLDTSNHQSADHKAYWIEAFRKVEPGEHCDKHRPEHALCREGADRHGCPTANGSSNIPASSGFDVCAMQTDTGGGHEAPPF